MLHAVIARDKNHVGSSISDVCGVRSEGCHLTATGVRQWIGRSLVLVAEVSCVSMLSAVEVAVCGEVSRVYSGTQLRRVL